MVHDNSFLFDFFFSLFGMLVLPSSSWKETSLLRETGFFFSPLAQPQAVLIPSLRFYGLLFFGTFFRPLIFFFA